LLKLNSGIEIATANVIASFQTALKPSEIVFISQPLNFSSEESESLKQNWEQQLRKKQTQLLAKEIKSDIRNYNEVTGNELALYIDEKPVMWPGRCITLRQFILIDTSLQLAVSEIAYPFISALSDPDFRRKISSAELLTVRPPLAICTFAITVDNFLVLTVRGEHTNVYPGRFYGQGGNPYSVNINLIQHQLDEMNDELFVSADSIDESTFRFLGLVEDLEQFPGKPDLIGIVNLRISREEVRRKFETRDLSDRPADVARIYFVALDKNTFFNFLLRGSHPSAFCPPAFAGLHLVGKNFFADPSF